MAAAFVGLWTFFFQEPTEQGFTRIVKAFETWHKIYSVEYLIFFLPPF
jgi:hypothetical protein